MCFRRLEIQAVVSLVYEQKIHPLYLIVHIMKKGKEKVFVPTLMDAGWHYSSRIHRFTYWEGDSFIERGIEHYRQRSKCPVTITVESKYYPDYYASLG